ncbi:hypothetical protein DACRYDRAFT_117353 [Dacryopinax primogenitus]|uniref:GATA-type domain-containing protein n=1 Tax=Dacryopinax primogenitus (strain DJM 731) TaxID=1858805 RepID=M5FSF0_DACPD|nr:uncharacterized protein DACRYDRAFT_117353 [Dacryopinax primogenitus]EJU00346.1 hypothetical protein DACRYDRAFT_117353 [Dacryopinax primogenitus]
MSTATSHWSSYMDSSNMSPHNHSEHNLSYYGGSNEGSRADPSIPRRLSQPYSGASGDNHSPFAYSPTNSTSYGHTYNNTPLTYPNQGHSSQQQTSFSSNNSYSNTSYNLSPASNNSSSMGSSMDYYSYSSSGQDTSTLQYSSGSINPAYLGGRSQVGRGVTSTRDSLIKSEPTEGGLAREAHSGSTGVLYPARIQYTDNATDKETSWLKRQCHVCGATSPPGWRKSVLKVGKIVCNACGLYEKTHHRPRPTRLSDESRNGVHRRVSATSATIAPGGDSPSRASFSVSPNLSRAPSDNRVQYASAYANTTTGSNPSSLSGSPVLQRATGSISSTSHRGSRSPPN